MDLVEVLSFLFMLSTMELGRVSHILLITTSTDAILVHRSIPPTRLVKHKRRCWRTFGITDSFGKERFGNSLFYPTLPHPLTGVIQTFQSYASGHHSNFTFASVTDFEYLGNSSGKFRDICSADYGSRTARVYRLGDQLQNICVHR